MGSKSRRDEIVKIDDKWYANVNSAHIMIHCIQGLQFSGLPPDTPPVLIVKCLISYEATSYWSSSKHLRAEGIQFRHVYISV